MTIRIGNIQIFISFYFLSFLTLMLIFDKSGLILVSLFCGVLHESGHILALILLRKKTINLKVALSGISLSKDSLNLNFFQELFVLIAGPSANLILCFVLLLTKNLNYFFAFSLISCIFNCIPIKPLDGGRILECILLKKFSDVSTYKIMRILSFFALTVVFLSSILILLNNKSNLSLLFISVYLLILTVTKN